MALTFIGWSSWEVKLAMFNLMATPTPEPRDPRASPAQRRQHALQQKLQVWPPEPWSLRGPQALMPPARVAADAASAMRLLVRRSATHPPLESLNPVSELSPELPGVPRGSGAPPWRAPSICC